MLLVLIVAKIALDLKLHASEREIFAPDKTSSTARRLP
jgi:hypothetical protein